MNSEQEVSRAYQLPHFLLAALCLEQDAEALFDDGLAALLVREEVLDRKSVV